MFLKDSVCAVVVFALFASSISNSSIAGEVGKFRRQEVGSFVLPQEKQPYATIVLCSDDPEYHIPRLRKFIDFVYGAEVYRVVDGRSVPLVELNEKVTLAYFGHQSIAASQNTCLSTKKPLLAFFQEKLVSESRVVEVYLDHGSDAVLQPARVLANSFKQVRHGSKTTEFVGLCYSDDVKCSGGYYPSLFGLDTRVCTEFEICE